MLTVATFSCFMYKGHDLTENKYKVAQAVQDTVLQKIAWTVAKWGFNALYIISYVCKVLIMKDIEQNHSMGSSMDGTLPWSKDLYTYRLEDHLSLGSTFGGTTFISSLSWSENFSAGAVMRRWGSLVSAHETGLSCQRFGFVLWPFSGQRWN